jgi:hypothetical protein
VIESPYRATVPPTIAYVESLHAQRPELTLTVVVPSSSCGTGGRGPCTTATPSALRRALRAPLGKVVVTSVPFHV